MIVIILTFVFISSMELVQIIQNSLVTVWMDVLGFLPQLFAAVVIILLGCVIAVILGKAASYVIRSVQLDRALDQLGLGRVISRAGFRMNSAFFFYELVKWFVIVVFLMAATNILGLSQVTDFLSKVLYYIPNVFVAVFILAIGVLVARFIEGVVSGSARAAELSSAHFLGTLAKWAVVIFSFVVALDQLGVASEIIRITITGVVAGLAIAIGLAFGLGGKNHAEEVIGTFRRKINM